MQILDLEKGKKIYLASDFHLGHPKGAAGREHEMKILRWLDFIAQDAALVVLLGDMFDFWYEYKKVVPKGFVRFQGKIASLVDGGVPVVLFAGNHDLWLFDYLAQELGVTILKTPQTVLWNGKKIYLAHGDGLGKGDYAYKWLKKWIFTNRFLRWGFEWLHPNLGVGLAHFWSDIRKRDRPREVFRGRENEWLWEYALEMEAHNPHDYYVFGHRHLPLYLKVGENSRYVNLGEWLNFYTYAVFEGEKMYLKRFLK
jgi:UDP-2,3-diacylglucosamine hydrolase